MVKPKDTMELLYDMDKYRTDIDGEGIILIESAPFLVSIETDGTELKCHFGGNTSLEKVVFADLYCKNPRCKVVVERGKVFINEKPIGYYTRPENLI